MDHETGSAAVPESPAGRPAEAKAELPVEVRDLATQSEMDACVRLQRWVWGEDYRDSVPASLIKVSQKVGGLAAGAFLESGELVGFVFGLTGIEAGGRVVHWSHMLAVLPEYRNRGVGGRLKGYQRERLAELGVESVKWTFDPLVARNAHLNVNRLRVRVVDYIEDMYENTGSDLHAFGTDRFVASWHLSEAPEAVSDGAPAEFEGAPVVNGDGADAVAAAVPLVRVEIPVDAESMRSAALEELRRWRVSTRSAFRSLLGSGYAVAGFERDGGRCYYLLRRPG